MVKEIMLMKKPVIPRIKTAILILLLNALTFLMSGCAHHVLKSVSPEELSSDTCYSMPMIYYLPNGKIRVQYRVVAGQQTQKNFTVDTVYMPDPQRSYILNYTGNVGYDDTVTVTLTDSGLLSKINITTESKAGEIVIRVMEIAKEAAKLLVPLPLPSGKPGAPPPMEDKPFDVTINPEDVMDNNPEVWEQIRRDQIDEYKNATEERKKQIYNTGNMVEKLLFNSGVISVRLKRLEQERWLRMQDKMAPLNKPSDFKTIYYRPVCPYEFRLIHTSFVVVQTVYLPNYEPVISLDISRPAFVKAVTNLTFKDGILTEVHLEKPSELLAALNIPLDILKAIAGIPAEMLQFRVKYGTDYVAYLNQQIQEIKLKQELQELKGQKQ